MQRRSFLRQSAAALIGVSGLSHCAREPSVIAQRWDERDLDREDPARAALSGGMLAPNAHNTQPWLLSPRGDAFELSIDPERLLPFTDPWYRQTHVSQGTFLETADVIASRYGLEAVAAYFPSGSYGPRELKPLPIARVSFVKRSQPLSRALSRAVFGRCSNKRVYEPVVIGQAEMESLTAAGSIHGCRVSVIQDEATRAKLADLLARAMAVEMADEQRIGESAKWFRFSQEELERQGDGFGLGQNGTAGLRRWLAETFFLSRDDATDPTGAFARGACDIAAQQAASASAFVVVSSEEPTRAAQVLSGRAFARIALLATQLGLALHPMSQVLEEYAEMQSLLEEFKRIARIAPGHTVQMLARLGAATPTPHTPRRALSDLMVQVG